MAVRSPASFDVIVAGLGAMGSATAYHLARAGRRVLGLDKFLPPHGLGSSHGESRIIRQAYFEDPIYVPLLLRAYELWDELSAAIQHPVLRVTGGVMVGAPDSTIVRGAERSARIHHLPCEILTAGQIQRRFPALRPAEHMIGLWEPRAGVLEPEQCIRAHLDLAQKHGALLHYDEPLRGWSRDGGGFGVTTDKGVFHTQKLVLSAGSWMSSLLPELGLPLTVERQPLFWFAARDASSFHPDHCPIYMFEYERDKLFYGFPDLGHGVKIAHHYGQSPAQPDSIDRNVGTAEVESIISLAQPYLPTLTRDLLRTTVCMYTNTPDGHFIIDRHPAHQDVLIVSPCSGHGFKFSSVIGEIVAAMAQEHPAAFDLTAFGMGRPALRNAQKFS